MRRTTPFALVLALLTAAPALAQVNFTQGEFFASVKGWTVMVSEGGCAAFRTDSEVIFNTPPAGGWQLVYPTKIPTDEGDFAGVTDVDKYSFADSFYSDGTWLYGAFPVEMRKAVGAGNRLYAEIDGQKYDVDLTGATAALLKVQECWTLTTGWSPETSSRAGTFAFSDDPLGK